MHEVTIDGQRYRRVETGGEKMYLIVVDNRGLTFVGRCDLSDDSEQIVIRGARCVVRWGTTNHLAELATGPREQTRLGAARDVIVWRRNLVVAYELDAEGWS